MTSYYRRYILRIAPIMHNITTTLMCPSLELEIEIKYVCELDAYLIFHFHLYNLLKKGYVL